MSEHAGASASHRFDGPISEHRADELARELREQTDEIVHVSTSSGSTGDARIHVPANLDDEDDHEVRCSGVRSWRDPRRKPVECFPPGWMTWCTRCAVTVLDLEAPPGVPIRPLPPSERRDPDE